MKAKRSPRMLAAMATVYVVLTAAAIVNLMPIIWMVSSSFKPQDEIYDTKKSNNGRPMVTILPNNPTLGNYRRLNVGGVDLKVEGLSLSFAPGEQTKFITVHITSDADAEEHETLRITLADPEGAELGPISMHELIIVDDDRKQAKPKPVPTAEKPTPAPEALQVEFALAGSLVEESSGTALLEVKLNHKPKEKVTVHYGISGGSATHSGALPVWRYMLNSMFLASVSTLMTLFFCSLGGYAFAKYVFPGREALFAIVLGSMMIPFQVLLIPLMRLMYNFHLVDTYWAIILPSATSAFGIFLMRQYIKGVPTALIEAARIDGASEFGIYWRIVVPIIRPAIGALTVLSFMNHWNSFLWPLTILHTEEKYTLPLGLANMFNTYQQEYGMLMAGTVISIIPILILFLFMQREFVNGMTLGGVKE